MIVLRSILLLATLACLGFLGYTLHAADLVGDPGAVATELEALVLSPWVQVVLAAYYLGVLCFLAAIVVIEKRPVPRILWAVVGVLLTYPALVFWLLLRGLPEMGERSARRLKTLG